MLKYDTERKADLKEQDPGKENKMFAVIRPSYINLESLKSMPLDRKEERGLRVVCSDKNKPGRNTVVKGTGLPG